jgi:hypothetical protein
MRVSLQSVSDGNSPTGDAFRLNPSALAQGATLPPLRASEWASEAKGCITFMANQIQSNQIRSSQTGSKTDETARPDDSLAVEFTSIPVTRHVGPTLESEPGYFDRERPGTVTPEAEIAARAATAEPSPVAIEEPRYDPVTGVLDDDQEPEPLKTRLPGDTSSDPHTDLGPDNAPNLPSRRRKR